MGFPLQKADKAGQINQLSALLVSMRSYTNYPLVVLTDLDTLDSDFYEDMSDMILVFLFWRCFIAMWFRFQGRENDVFGKRCFCPLPKAGGFDENGENVDLHSNHKIKGAALLRARKPTKMTKMAGAPQTKPPFAKNTVFATLKICRAKPLRTQKGAYEFDLRDPTQTYTGSGTGGKPQAKLPPDNLELEGLKILNTLKKGVRHSFCLFVSVTAVLCRFLRWIS